MTDNLTSVPITILAGYLGAGKTTYVNELLANRADRDGLAVLINDFGSINVDEQLIRSKSPNGRIIGLANGCVCCSIQDDFTQALTTLQSYSINEVILEASGVALPEKLRSQCCLPGYHADIVNVLVDASAYDKQCKDKYIGELVMEQVRQADECIVTKLVLNPTFTLPKQSMQSTGNATARFISITLQQAHPIDAQDHLRTALDCLPDWVQRTKGFVELSDGHTLLIQATPADCQIRQSDIQAKGAIVFIAPETHQHELASYLAEHWSGPSSNRSTNLSTNLSTKIWKIMPPMLVRQAALESRRAEPR